MKLYNSEGEIFVPDNSSVKEALERTTHLCIAAHQDDIEIMAAGPIISCFDRHDLWFTGVVVTDGSGSPRTGAYESYTDEEMKTVRASEQKNAATIGGYSAQLLLSYKSNQIKDASNKSLVEELSEIIKQTNPQVIFTHNLADKHDTHVALALRVIEAIRSLPPELRPAKVYSLEVWRGLDWLCDEDKIIFNTSEHEDLQTKLLGAFDSQIAGGKRYDCAAMGRRLANATFYESHNTDDLKSACYGLDITSLINDEKADAVDFITGHIDNFKKDVIGRMKLFL